MAKQTSVKQRRKRRAKHVKRVEFVLYADNDRDLAIYNHLVQLTRHNEASDFIKDALYRAIAGQGDQPSGGPGNSAIMAELAELKAELKQELRRRQLPAMPPADPRPTMMHDSADQGSAASAPAPDDDKYGGLDMSRRRRAGPPKVITPAPTPAAAPVLDARAARAAREQLLASIRSYGG